MKEPDYNSIRLAHTVLAARADFYVANLCVKSPVVEVLAKTAKVVLSMDRDPNLNKINGAWNVGTRKWITR